MQGTAEFHHDIADAFLPQTDPVFDNATALDTPIDMLDPQPAIVQGLWARCCSSGNAWPRGFFVGRRISTWGSVKARKPSSCNNRLPAGKGDGVASAIRLSWTRPPYVSLRKRIVRGAWTSRTFFTVWSFVFPL
jgi:hypothetical protein